MHPMSGSDQYFLGLPAWAFPGWKDRYFTDAPTRLASYASVFDTVEGNTTFYRTPDSNTVSRWRDAVAGCDFRFSFKLPRNVTHEHNPDMEELHKFLQALAPLEAHLAPMLVQFPATVAPGDLRRFEPVFAALADRHRFVVEVRHLAFFDEPERLEPVLERFRAGRVVLDSRPLYQGDRNHPEVLDALHAKPDVPVLTEVYNSVALLRLILHPDIVSNRPYIDEWATHVAGFLNEGVETYVMIHCPNNLHCPPLARDFHDTLKARADSPDLQPLAPWPLPAEQQSLFPAS